MLSSSPNLRYSALVSNPFNFVPFRSSFGILRANFSFFSLHPYKPLVNFMQKYSFDKNLWDLRDSFLEKYFNSYHLTYCDQPFGFFSFLHLFSTSASGSFRRIPRLYENRCVSKVVKRAKRAWNVIKPFNALIFNGFLRTRIHVVRIYENNLSYNWLSKTGIKLKLEILKGLWKWREMCGVVKRQSCQRIEILGALRSKSYRRLSR